MFGKLLAHRQEGQSVILKFASEEVTVTAVTSRIIRVCAPRGQRVRSLAVEGDKTKWVSLTVTEAEGALRIRTEEVCLSVDLESGAMDFLDSTGAVLCADYRGKRELPQTDDDAARALAESEGHRSGDAGTRYAIEILKALDEDDSIYGLGDKTGFLNKRAYAYEMWNTDDPAPQEDNFKSLYKSIPFMIVRKTNGVYGLFFDSHEKSTFDLGKENPSYFLYGCDAGALDYYLIAGDDMPAVVEGYTYLTGRTPLPQLWSLGYHQSRWGYRNETDVRELAEKLRENRIPCDCIHLDIDYMDGYRVFTWDKERFPDPEGLLRWLAQQGLHIVTIIDPGVKVDPGYAVYDEGIAGDFFAHASTGEVYENAVWPGDAVYPDFGKPSVRDWWGKQHAALLDMGVSGIWNDMNEPASFHGPLPDDVVFWNEDAPSTHRSMHNVYGHNMARATFEGVRKHTGKRPFVITRACYSGSQKVACVWTGDNHSIWSHLRMAIPQLCNLGLSGIPFAGTDVGGFGSDVTPELLMRWYQVGCFSPLFRNHSATGTRRQEPWQFGKETLDVIRKYVNLRYELLPYFYDLFWEMQRTGLPVIRPLVLHYGNDPQTRNLNDEFLVGASLLVAPVVEQGAGKRLVYLPRGIWYDYWTKARIEGGRHLIADAPIDHCPLYVKEGAVLPKYPLRQHVGPEKDETLLLEVYPGDVGYTHYQDNGLDFAYESGSYNAYRFTRDKDGSIAMRMQHEGYPVYRHIEIVSIPSGE